jgi:hypothetical protein
MLERELKENVAPQGVWSVTYEVHKDGVLVGHDPLDFISPKMRRELSARGDRPILAPRTHGNLVVNSGRAMLARLLTAGFKRHIAFIQLGDGVKSLNPPSLLNTGVAREIRKLDTLPGGTFAIDSDTDVFLPVGARRFPLDLNLPWGSTATVTIDGATGQTIITDGAVNFNTLGVLFSDQVVLNTPTAVPLALAVRRIISATQLELHNPHGYTGAGLQYRVENPGTQVLFSKLIRGSEHFPAADYGAYVIVHESSLLFNDGAAWNRVTYAQDDSQGILIQSPDILGVELSARFEGLVTF